MKRRLTDDLNQATKHIKIKEEIRLKQLLYDYILYKNGEHRFLEKEYFFDLYRYLKGNARNVELNLSFFIECYQSFIPNFLGIDIQGMLEFASQYYNVLSIHAFNTPMYSVGDSLEKFNFAWNMVYEDHPIRQIPLSGHFFEDTFEPVHFDSEKYLLFSFHNPIYLDLVQTLRSGQSVIITDFGAQGKAIASLCLMLLYEGVDLSLIHFIIGSMDCQHLRDALQFLKQPLRMTCIDMDPLFFFTNADWKTVQSRCTPRYSIDMWDQPMDVIWKNTYQEEKENYFLCNLARFITSMVFVQILHRK